MNQSTKEKGKIGEDRAAEFLEKKGFKIVTRNFRTREGEIDIIAEKDDLIVFAEVKRLPAGNLEILAHELNSVKQKKIIKTSKCYLEKYRQYKCKFVRYDVLAVDVPALDPVHHIENAFSE